MSYPLLSAYCMGSIILNTLHTQSQLILIMNLYHGKYFNSSSQIRKQFAPSLPAKWQSQHLNPDQSDFPSRPSVLSITVCLSFNTF